MYKIDSILYNQLVIVYEKFQGFGLRSKADDGSWYDENEFLDDSETVWTHWAPLPFKPNMEG